MNDYCFSGTEAAELVNVSVGLLFYWRRTQVGFPTGTQVGHRVYYSQADVDVMRELPLVQHYLARKKRKAAQ